MPVLEIETPKLKELLFNFKRYSAISEKWIQKAIEASAAELHKAANRGNVPWRTGRLVQSFQVAIGRLFAKVWPTAKYARFVYFGTKKHVILPRTKRALYWEGARHPVKSVMHPGQKENRFLERMIKVADSRIAKHFKDAGDNITKEIANI